MAYIWEGYFKRPSGAFNDRIEHFRAYIPNQKTKLYQNSVIVENIFLGRKWLTYDSLLNFILCLLVIYTKTGNTIFKFRTPEMNRNLYLKKIIFQNQINLAV